MPRELAARTLKADSQLLHSLTLCRIESCTTSLSFSVSISDVWNHSTYVTLEKIKEVGVCKPLELCLFHHKPKDVDMYFPGLAKQAHLKSAV